MFEQVNKVTLLPGECLSSYDVTALFTLVPVEMALGLIEVLLEKRQYFKGKSSVTGQKHNSLIGILPPNAYFSFQDKFYEQVESAAMGSPVSPIVANLYMEYFEQKALSTPTQPSRMWLRYVDETFVIQREDNKQNSL